MHPLLISFSRSYCCGIYSGSKMRLRRREKSLTTCFIRPTETLKCFFWCFGLLYSGILLSLYQINASLLATIIGEEHVTPPQPLPFPVCSTTITQLLDVFVSSLAVSYDSFQLLANKKLPPASLFCKREPWPFLFSHLCVTNTFSL